MASWRARGGAATLSIFLHAALLWMIASWNVAEPGSDEAPIDRVVVSLAPPRAAQQPPPRAAQPAPPPPAPPPNAVEAVAPAPQAEPPVPESPPEPPPPEVEIPLPAQQIVTMPNRGEERPPTDTRFLSDRDNVVDEQSVRRGEPAPSRDLDGDDVAAADPDSDLVEPDLDRATTEIAPADGDPARQSEADSGRAAGGALAARALPNLERLMPNALALAAQQAKNDAVAKAEPAGAPARQARRQRAVAWEPSTALRGTLDHLPDVRPGNVTLLNTKAEVFAPFVRRVMLRVFQNMMIMLRHSAGSMRPGADEQIEAEAIMSPAGDMIGLRFIQRSTSMSIGLDRMLAEACNEAFFDRNPPPGAAAADGNIHFVMRTVVQTYPAPGTRGVALSGMFGVGLL